MPYGSENIYIRGKYERTIMKFVTPPTVVGTTGKSNEQVLEERESRRVVEEKKKEMEIDGATVKKLLFKCTRCKKLICTCRKNQP